MYQKELSSVEVIRVSTSRSSRRDSWPQLQARIEVHKFSKIEKHVVYDSTIRVTRASQNWAPTICGVNINWRFLCSSHLASSVMYPPNATWSILNDTLLTNHFMPDLNWRIKKGRLLLVKVWLRTQIPAHQYGRFAIPNHYSSFWSILSLKAPTIRLYHTEVLLRAIK